MSNLGNEDQTGRGVWHTWGKIDVRAYNIDLIPSGFKQTETFDSVSVRNKVFDKLDNLLFFQTVGAAENN